MSPRPSRWRRAGIVACFLASFGASLLQASESTQATGAGSTAASESSAALPATVATETSIDSLAFKPENLVSRFEIVSLGSYPITLFYVGLAFDIQRYIANDFNSSYIPLYSSVALDESERWTRLSVALALSAVVGGIDLIIHASKVKAAKRLRESWTTVPSP